MPVDAYGNVRTLVRGLPYQCPDDWEEVLDSLDEDSNLYLIKEPDNPKDNLAIAAYLDDRRVGYVAATDNGKIWLYLTDDKMPCKFIERFDASFKIAFENPRYLFEDMPFKEIYRDKQGIIDRQLPSFEIPYLTNPKDKCFNWFDDNIHIADLERAIPDFRRKLASRMIIIVGRKNKKAEYCYYLPYLNRPISDIEDGIIRGLIDRYGFVIALPDVPIMTNHGNGILMDLHVTYLKKTEFKEFSSAHHSQLVFNLTRDFVNNVTEEDDEIGNMEEFSDKQNLTVQNCLSLSYNYEDDYLLKEGEIINYHIDNEYFDEIDKITTDLYSFVREKLFQSTELFAYLRKRTPYAMQIFNFDDYETLIKVFVIKDLGRIYKTLNHSINFDTLEGKVLFLYITKEARDSQKEKYGIFKMLCNKEMQPESVIKMRGSIEHYMKIFYNYDIALWTNDDFMIHSFLKEIDKMLAQKYKDILNLFTSVINKTESKQEVSSKKISHTPSIKSSTFNDFFPIYGISLGKTTWKQVEDMGYEVRIYKEGPSRVSDVNNISFWDDDGKGVFTSLYWTQNDYEFPSIWKSKGFSWDNSYDEWIGVFKNLGFKVEIKKEPNVKEYSGHDTFSAEFRAISSDSSLDFDLDFDYGENGCNTSSPKTLYSIMLYYEGECLHNLSKNDVEESGRYEINDSPEGGKHVSMDVIVPEEGDDDYDFCIYEARVREKEHIELIKGYMKCYKEGKEPRPFLMIGRSLLGPTDLDIFYSLDGEKIFNFIFEEKIKRWIREAGFVLGQVKSYKKDPLFPEQLSVELLVSKRKSGEKLFKQASEKAMDYIEERSSSLADKSVEKRVVKEVKRYMSGKSAMPYKVFIVIKYGLGVCKTQDGEDIAFVYKSGIVELAETNNGLMGEIVKVDYDDDGDVWFTIRVSRSVPRFSLD